MSSSNNVNTQAASVGVNQVGSRTFVSGQGLGFDTSSLVNAAVQQRERPAVQLDARTQLNLAEIEAFNQLDTLGTSLNNTLSRLVYTDDILGEEFNVFDQKAVSAVTNTPVAATDLIDAVVGNAAEAGTYDITVNQLAQAMRIQSGEVTDSTAALGLAGTFRIGAEGSSNADISVTAGQSLDDIAAAINATTASSGVSAEVLQTSPNGYRLIISAEETNRQINALDLSGDAVLSGIGVFTYPAGPRDFSDWTLSGTVNTGFAAPDGSNDAIRVIDNDAASNQSATKAFSVNSTDASNTAFVHVQKTPGGDTHFPVLSLQYADGTRGDVTIDTNNGTVIGRNNAENVQIVDRGSWWEVTMDVANVNNASSATMTLFYATANAGTNAFEASGTGAYTVWNAGLVPQGQAVGLNVVQQAQAAEITLDGITFTRDTNEFSDVIDDVDIDLRSADPNTTITLEVGNDTSAVRDSVNAFIEQYNELRVYMDAQQVVSETGEVDENSVLNGDTTLGFMQTSLSALLASRFNSSGDIQSLRDIGIDINENNQIFISDTVEFEDQLANNFDQFRALFETSFESNNDQIRLREMSGTTQRLAFTLDITTDGSGNVTGATANGNPVFDVSPSGLLTGIQGSVYEGLSLAYAAGVDATIDIVIEQGIADMMSSTLNDYTNDFNGQIKEQVDRLTVENTENDQRAERIRSQAADLRDTLIARYADLEAKVREAEIVQSQIKALLGNNDDD